MKTIVVAGPAGRLGHRIVKALVARQAHVKALVRSQTAPEKIALLRKLGAEVVEVDLNDVEAVTKACAGASCVVSALLGLRPVMVDAQGALLDAAVKAGVPRFIPSDYAMDFTRLEPGTNRNLDLHSEFQRRLDTANIKATSILNGAFMELLTGPAPLILFKFKRTLYWRDPDQPLDFTSMDDTAAITAAAALDDSAPRWVNVVGDRITARQLAQVMTELTGQKFKAQWAGSLGSLRLMIAVAKLFDRDPGNPFPAWQGMQYSRNMFEGSGLLSPVNNDRYPEVKLTNIRRFFETDPEAKAKLREVSAA